MSSDPIYIDQFVRIQANRAITKQGTFFQKENISLEAFLTELYDHLRPAYPKFYKMDRQSQLGFLAAEILLRDRSLSTEFAPESIAIILSNAHASMDTDRRYYESTKTFASPGLFVYTLANIVAGEISIRQKIKGENAFFVSDRFDPEWMADYVVMVMEKTTTRACVAGWVDLIDDQPDVFLYLAEKDRKGNFLAHKATNLAELYKNGIWKN
jgi:hypothetical protein